MAKLDLLNHGYKGRSTRLDASRMVNLYPETGGQAGEPPNALVGTPGLKLFTRAGDGVIRGQHVFNDVMYVVVGNALYFVSADGTLSDVLGTLQTSSGRVIMADNGLTPTGGDQLIIVDGTYTYIFYIGTSAWIEKSTITDSSINGSGIAWNGTVFCVVGTMTGTLAYTSPDGITWTPQSLPGSGTAWRSIAWNGTVFCVIDSSINGTRAATSPDGITWTPQTLPAAGAASAWYSITAKGARFCAVSYNSNLAAWSNDGAAWTPATLPSTANWVSITSAGSPTNAFCAIAQNSNKAATSSTGVTWTPRTLPSSGSWLSVASNGINFLAVGTYPLAATSVNGTVWAAQSLPCSGDAIQAIAWNGNIWMVLDSSSGYCATSPDGAAWTLRNMPSSAYWNAVAWNGTVFCASSNTVFATTLYSQYFDGPNLVRTHTDVAAFTSCFIGGYFAVDMGGGQWRISELYDGLKWSDLYKSTADALPDSLLAVFNNHGELWLLGEKTTEVWYQSGVGSPPFARVAGGVLDYGCAARYSVTKGSNTIFWLATMRNNNQCESIGVVVADGYSIRPIMPPAIIYQLDQYSDISDAWGYCYSDAGHNFYVLTFPTAGATWVYDITTDSWHERSYSALTGTPYTTGRHIGNTYSCFNGKHYLGSYLNGNVYEMSQEFVDDAGKPIDSFRTFSYLRDNDTLNNIFFNRLEINTESGINQIEDFCAIADNGDYSALSSDNGVTWSAGTFPSSLAWRNIAHNGTVFCAIPYPASDKAAISSDGINWTEVTLPTSTGWLRVCWNGTVFLAIAGGNIAATSPDGITWTPRTLPASDSWAALVWTGTMFVLSNTAPTNIYTSPDGINWTTITGMSGQLFASSMTWNGKVLCAVSNVGGAGKSYVSADGGNTWTSGNLPTGGSGWNGLAWNGTVFCTARSDSTQAAISTDGLTWTETALPVNFAWLDNCLAWNGAVFCLVSNNSNTAATSPDGITWTPQTLPAATSYYAITSLSNKMIVPNSIYLSWSDDGGHTWTADKEMSLGAYGDNAKRTIWQRLGFARQRIFRMRMSTAKKKIIVSANIEVEMGTS